MRKIPLTTYIAYNNPAECQRILMKHGKSKARNYNDLAQKIAALVVEKREDVLADIGAAHPDKGLILATNEVEAAAEDIKSGACGCSGADGSSGCGCNWKSGNRVRVSNVEGNEPTFMQSLKPYAPAIIGGTLLLVGLVVIMKNA